jgi:V/A-type H+-transporting ATPase subunit F
MSNYKIAVLGDRDSVLGFQALGLTVCPAETHVKPMLEKMEALGFDVQYLEHDDGHSFHASRLWLADTVVKALQER